MTERRKRGQSAVGIELHGWVGFGVDRDLFHRYARVGLVTVYVTDVRLHDFLNMMRAARNVLRGDRDRARPRLDGRQRRAASARQGGTIDG